MKHTKTESHLNWALIDAIRECLGMCPLYSKGQSKATASEHWGAGLQASGFASLGTIPAEDRTPKARSGSP